MTASAFRDQMLRYLRETTPEERASWRDSRERRIERHPQRDRGCAARAEKRDREMSR